MSIRERLKSAYENVAHSADKTWINELHGLQKLNMDLHVKEDQLRRPIIVDLRPRTVRDCIPYSKLARYSNYEYNDSRELSYTVNDFRNPSSLCFTDEFENERDKEPWMLKEVHTLYKWYSEYPVHLFEKEEKLSSDNTTFIGTSYESPFFKSNSLPEYLLKIQVTRDSVKKLWNAKDPDYTIRELQSLKREDSLLISKSSLGQFYVSEYDDLTKDLKKEYCDWFKDDYSDLDHLNLLSDSFNVQNEKKNEILDNQTDSAQQRRLYSAVLQGYTSNKIPPQTNEGQMTILRRNITKNEKSVSELEKKKTEEDISKLKENILDRNISKTFLTTKSAQTTSTASDVGISNTVYSYSTKVNSSYQQESNFRSSSRHYSNNFLPNITPSFSNATPRYRQTYVPSNYHYPSFYMFIQNSFQQQQHLLQPSIYNPLLLHRSVPTNYERAIPQRTLHLPIAPQYVVPTSNFVTQTQHNAPNNFQRYDNQIFKPKVKTKSENLTSRRMRNNLKKAADFSPCSSFKLVSNNVSSSQADLNEDIDDLVSKTVNLVLEDKNEKIVPVALSHSDELERQALEQYSNSNENVYQELERQAAEEYEDCSENCENPPNRRVLFGGFFNHCRFLICYG